jgi:hypothetical protein
MESSRVRPSVWFAETFWQSSCSRRLAVVTVVKARRPSHMLVEIPTAVGTEISSVLFMHGG